MRETIIYFDGKHEVLDTNTSHHIAHVLRKSVGDTLIGYDGFGNIYTLKITSISKKAITVMVLDTESAPQTLPSITLILSAYKPQRLEFALEKCTELGIDEFVITETEYSSASIEHLQHKSSRFEKILQQACLQSEQPWFPQLDFLSFEDVLNTSWNLPYVGVTKETQAPAQIERASHRTFFIGPEGGFSLLDIERIIDAGFTPIHPFEHVLRSETAAIAFASLAQHYS